jgi:hypothetical protein
MWTQVGNRRAMRGRRGLRKKRERRKGKMESEE